MTNKLVDKFLHKFKADKKVLFHYKIFFNNEFTFHSNEKFVLNTLIENYDVFKEINLLGFLKFISHGIDDVEFLTISDNLFKSTYFSYTFLEAFFELLNKCEEASDEEVYFLKFLLYLIIDPSNDDEYLIILKINSTKDICKVIKFLYKSNDFTDFFHLYINYLKESKHKDTLILDFFDIYTDY